MPNVSFYILSDQSTRTVDQLVCQLCVKAAGQSHVHLLLPADKLQHMDELLWSFDATTFLPHGIDTAASHDTGAKSDDKRGMVNLTAQRDGMLDGMIINQQDDAILAPHAQRIIEIIAADEASKVSGRTRYQAYKDAGYTLETFHV